MPETHPIRRFVLRGVLVTCVVFVTVSWVAVQQLRELAIQEASARARLVADSLAAQVQRAVKSGVPIDRLVGVEDLFAQRMAAFDDLLGATLLDSQGRVLHTRKSEESDAPTLTQRASVALDGVPRATLELSWRQPSTAALLSAWALPLVALLAFTLALAVEALRYTLHGQVLRRARLVRTASDRIAEGDFAFRTPRIGRREFDTRLPWLGTQMRHAVEQHRRIERLTHSLRRTEPDLDKREELDQLMLKAAGNDRFDTAAAQPLVDRRSELALRRWRGIQLGLLAWALAMVAGALQPPLTLMLGTTLLIMGLAAARRWGWWIPDASGRLGAVLGGLVLGLGGCLLVLLAWTPQRFETLGPFGPVVLALCGLGAIVLPWYRVAPERAAHTPNGEAVDAA